MLTIPVINFCCTVCLYNHHCKLFSLSLRLNDIIVKGRYVFFTIFLIVVIDQALKVFVKTHYNVGEWRPVLGNWFRLYFIENEGMAYGWKFGGEFGKMLLTLFRLAAVIFGVFYLQRIIKKKYHPGFIFCAALIFAGALGNLIDSMFYGLIFTNSPDICFGGNYSSISNMMQYHNATCVAKLVPFGSGYGKFLQGRVVDMLYFPIVDTQMPGWVPFIGGKNFIFFEPVFNVADAAISVGVITLVLFQKRLVHRKNITATTVSENVNVKYVD